MDEKILIKGEIGHIKKIRNVIFTIGMVIVAIPGVVTTGLIIDLLNFKENFPTSYGAISHKEENATIFLAISIILLIICLLITGITYKYLSKISIVVTDKRVYGTAMFGKQVDLPLDSISALGRGMFSSIAVATSSGKIIFWGISNIYEVHETISELLQNRQSEKRTASAPINHITQQAQSSADELKKYKELLDNGIISQEEFDAKKKQLLDL